jgi:HAD superfamily hydrolase (TIGR01450 family)
MTRALEDFDGYFFDLDGCVYEGDSPVPAASELISLLRERGKKIAFLSNNSAQGAAEIALKLRSMEIPAEIEEVFLPTDFVGEFLRAAYGSVSVYSIGNELIAASIAASSHRLVGEGEGRCDVVFVARDVDFSFLKLERAARYLQEGASFVAANPDAFHTGNEGRRVPETGALVASISTVAGRDAKLLGKPEPYLFLKALERLGLESHKALMIGDNPVTDIIGAEKAGLASVWIDMGLQEPPNGALPISTFRSLSDLLDAIKKGDYL